MVTVGCSAPRSTSRLGLARAGVTLPPSPIRARLVWPDLMSTGDRGAMPPPLRRDIPGDAEPHSPTGDRSSRPADGPPAPRAWKPGRADPAERPTAMVIATTLAVLAGVAGLLT